MRQCLSADEVQDVAEGRLPPAPAREAQQHLDECASCRQLVVVIARSRIEATSSAESPPGTSQLEMPIGRGTEIGRYLVSSLLGAGAMGAVYAGYDPELDRRVAIKLVHDRGGPDDAAHQDRLRLEARSMARLVHPNVVRIYDVGIHGARTFIAMELVEGRTLRRWLHETRRSPSEIREAFIAAGRGLSAAHEAGLVHGDFKPDNVLVAFDGRVEVGDFGLARPLDQAGVGVGGLLTVGGTPAYLAPEVLAGGSPSAASDQFAFCVALWEGLYESRPFEGRTPQQLLEEIRSREPQTPLRREVDARVRKALLKGLHPEPSARHASMSALLDALDRRPRPWRLVTAGTLALAALLVFGLRSTSVRCSGARAQLASTWSPAREAALAAAFHAAGLDAAWPSVDRALSDFAASWIEVETRSCIATRVEGNQSDEVLERRSRCLTRQRQVVSALGDLWLRAPTAVLSKAPAAVASLPLPATCGGDGPLNAEKLAAPPPAIADLVAADQRRLAEVAAQLAAGDPAAALALARDTAGSAAKLGYPPLEAEAALSLGRALQQHGDLDEAERTLNDAALASASARHEQALAESLVLLARFVGTMRARPDDAERLVARATPVVAHLGDRKLSSDLEILRGDLLLDHGKPEAAQTALEAQLPVLEALVGADHPAVAELQHDLFKVAHQLGRNAAARAHAEAEIRVLERAMPPGHIKLYPALTDLAAIEAEVGNLDSAHQLFERAWHLAEKNQGPGGPLVASSLANLAVIVERQGELTGAHDLFEHALQIALVSRGPASPVTAYLELQLGEMDWRAGETGKAIAHLRVAAERREKVFGRRHVDTVEALTVLGRAQIDAGEPGGMALVLESDALIRELSPNARRRMHSASNACEALLEARRPADARPYCEAMLASALAEWPLGHPGTFDALSLTTSLELAENRAPTYRAALESALGSMSNGAFPRETNAVRFALARLLARSAEAEERKRSAALASEAVEVARHLGTRRPQLAPMIALADARAR
jgi:tetratricopeptide (TPR) repeat protein